MRYEILENIIDIGMYLNIAYVIIALGIIKIQDKHESQQIEDDNINILGETEAESIIRLKKMIEFSKSKAG